MLHYFMFHASLLHAGLLRNYYLPQPLHGSNVIGVENDKRISDSPLPKPASGPEEESGILPQSLGEGNKDTKDFKHKGKTKASVHA